MTKFLAIFALLATVAFGQQAPIPADLGTAPLTMDTANRSNIAGYNMSVSGIFDDNATDPQNSAQGVSDYRFSFQPRAFLDLKRSRVDSHLFYAPSYTYSSNINAYNATGQLSGVDFQYFFSKRLSLHFVNSYSLTNNPYESYQAIAELPSVGVLAGPNASVIGSNVRNSTEVSRVDFVYRLGRHTSVGVGGGFTNLDYRTPAGSVGSALQHARTWTGNAFYSQELTARYSAGFQYTAETQGSSTPSGQFSLLSHQILGFVDVKLNSKVNLSIFAGPQYSEIDNSFVQTTFSSHLNRSSFAGGATLNWQGKHNGLTASFVQQVSDSGLNSAGSLLVQTVTVKAQHNLGAGCRLNLFGNSVWNSQLAQINPVPLMNTASAGIGISKLLAPRISVEVSGVREQFMGTPGLALSGFTQHNHDLATVTLSYHFARPIGR